MNNSYSDVRLLQNSQLKELDSILSNHPFRPESEFQSLLASNRRSDLPLTGQSRPLVLSCKGQLLISAPQPVPKAERLLRHSEKETFLSLFFLSSSKCGLHVHLITLLRASSMLCSSGK